MTYLEIFQALGTLAALVAAIASWKSYRLQVASKKRPPLIFETKNFTGYKDDDVLEWRVNVVNSTNLSYALLSATSKTPIFRSDDGLTKTGVARRYQGDEYIFKISRAAVEKPVKVVFEWRWMDDLKRFKSVSTIRSKSR